MNFADAPAHVADCGKVWNVVYYRLVTLIGINFSARKRNIDEPVIEGVTT